MNTYPAIEMVDVESLCVTYLKASAVNTLVGGRIAGELNAKSARPAISLSVTGGVSPVEWRLITPAVQVDVWGTARQETREIAITAHATLVAMLGAVSTIGVVTGVRTLIGVRPFPDQDDPRPRYQFEIQVAARPL